MKNIFKLTTLASLAVTLMLGSCTSNFDDINSDPDALETGVDGIQRTSIYYCDPMRSGQKGGIENVHTKLREILPKGTSFEHLTQWDLNLIVNNINSVPRQSLLGLTPYQTAKENFDMDVLLALQLKPIEPDKINLTPELIK